MGFWIRFLSEQGAESVHEYKANSILSSIADKKKRMVKIYYSA